MIHTESTPDCLRAKRTLSRFETVLTRFFLLSSYPYLDERSR
jgi:hypothetical protein